jgi:outer membrane protein assembly factor BamB
MASTAPAEDWPQWLGPDRDGATSEVAQPWSNQPKEVWRADFGIGYSTMTIRDGRAYTMGNVDDRDEVYCLDARTGKRIWTQSYPCPKSANGYYGPRCTPAVDDQRVYTVSHQGQVYCFRAGDGKVLWNKNLLEMGYEAPKWGISTSPLLREDTILIEVGAILALRKTDGRIVMKSRKFPVGYSSPMVFEAGGKSLVASFPAYGLIVAEEDTGEIVATAPWKTPFNVNAVTPLQVKPSRLFITSGYRRGAALYDLAREDLVQIWKTRELGSQMNQCVLQDGHLYGFTGNVRGRGGLRCISAADGSLKWEHDDRRKLGVGSVLLAADRLVILGEHGWLMLAEATPEGFKPLCEAKILEGDYCWTPPVLANGLLYCRNYDKGKGSQWVCLDVSGE